MLPRPPLCRIYLLSGCWLLVAANWCAANEPYLPFLHALQRYGYGEQALAYLDQIAERPDLPPELKQTLDLERSQCLQIAARETSGPEQRASRLAEAKRLADKFAAENPLHPAAGEALLSEGNESLLSGQNSLAQARGAHEDDLKAQAFADARIALSAARDQFDVAVKELKARLDAIPKSAEPAAKGQPQPRDELEFSWLKARFSRALADFLLAQTYPNAKDRQRLDLLKKAGSVFEAIFQEYRPKNVALMAHMWQGRALEELGDSTLALDVYDEVLVASPDGAEADADPDLAPLFGQAEYFRLRLMVATGDPKAAMQEGDEWLQQHKRWQPLAQNQGIALEVAKARIQSAEKARSATEKSRLIREALALLVSIGKVETEYRHEAMLVRREVMTKMGTGGSLSFDECVALAVEAAGERNWSAAESLYRQAIEIAKKNNDARRGTTARTSLAQILYKETLVRYAAGDMEKALAVAGEIVRDNADDPVAEEASTVAVAAALTAFTSATDDGKEAALARLQKVADYTIGHWPDKAVGDDARMALAQAALLKGDSKTALERLAQVTSESKRYPTALQILAQVRWKQYVEAKRSPDAEDRAEEIQKLRTEAMAHLRTSVERQRASWQMGTEPMPTALYDTQLLLGEMFLEGQQGKEAAALFEPLLQLVNTVKPTTLDAKTQRVLVGAARAYIATGDANQTSQAVQTLAALSTDAAQSNSVLVDLAKLLGIEIKKADAAQVDGAEGANAANPVTAQFRELQLQLLDTLAARKELTVPQLIYVGKACTSLDKNDKAREVYQRLLATIDKDPAAKATAGAATTQIRAELVGLLRSEGKLDEASKQVDALIKEHPNAIEPLMEKGNILQTLAERDPRRWDECLKHWTDLRVRLGRSKTRLPEYYEALYNAATCLVRQARLSNSKDKALQAEQMLRQTLTLTPKLSSPDMVTKYEALLNVAAAMRSGASPTPGGNSK